MSDAGDKALLPAGLQDILPPDAAHEAAVVERLIASFAAQGFERIKPPLMEFEETLLAGAGAAVAQETFRLMDPVSHRMMGLRADMTPQVARIAATRLGRAPRPLRLCYGGEVLRVKGSQLRSVRQFRQVGVELIGAGQDRADAEVVLLAAGALEALGVAALSVDLSLPTLVTALAGALDFEQAAIEDLKQALDRKDAAAVERLSGGHKGMFQDLLRAAGSAEKTLAALAALDLPDSLRPAVERLARVVALIEAAAPGLSLTIDPVEHRGFEYQTGISFTFFAKGVRGELGRGGRYQAERGDGQRESSTGFTLYMDSVLRALPEAAAARKLFLPVGTTAAEAAALRGKGWVTLSQLGEADDPEDEARRLGCSHLLRNGSIEEL